MKRICYMVVVMMVALLASCSGNSFKIDGNISGLENVAVRVVFTGDSGFIDESVILDQKGHFSFKGATTQPVIVNMLNPKGEILVSMVATGGDHIKVKGDGSKAMGVKVKGGRVNEDWQLFRDEHAAFYTDPNPSRLDAAIEKYVREHPADMLSTVLLVADYRDYSDRAKVEKLLKSIDAKARPESLTRGIDIKGATNASAHMPRLMDLTLIKHGGDFEEIHLTGHTSLISLWVNPQENRNAIVSKLQDLDEDVSVIDVLAESDTLRWHNTIANDPNRWKHYWAPGGPLEQGIQLLGPTSMPWFAVTDSTGMVTYSGPDLDAALRNIHPHR
ncbi:MAG: DUF4369 domain-containing protein [Muribaculaceae bacterium]|nr:DUF4369 domain-containing protein [Muribaculaceae bacterium]